MGITDMVRIDYPNFVHVAMNLPAAVSVPFGYAPDMSTQQPTIKTGTISKGVLTTNVVGVGTNFVADVVVGDWIKGADRANSEYSQVQSITDATNLVLRHAYRGADLAADNWMSRGSQLVRGCVITSSSDLTVVRFMPQVVDSIEPNATDGGFQLPDQSFATTFIFRHRFVRVLNAVAIAIRVVGFW